MPTEKTITTLRDLIEMKKLDGLRLIAGHQGLDREVNTCCILDYEYDPELKNKFSYTNFKPGMLILTSFMYAKDREYLISDAIRQLIATGISGLAIKNVYHLRIQDSVLRYADSRNFPIFLIDDTGLFVEPIIFAIHEGIRMRQDENRHGNMIDAILRLPMGEAEEARRAYELYPGMGRHYMAYYFYGREGFPPEAWVRADDAVRGAGACRSYRYRNGVLLLCSVEIPSEAAARAECAPIVAVLREALPPCSIGVSELHHTPTEVRAAIEESTQAALVCEHPGMLTYAETGSYRALFPAVREPRMQAFSRRILDPIMDFDVESSSRLQKTVFGLIACGGDLHALSAQLGQHENTLRQRMAKVMALTGLDFRKNEQYEQLSLAVKIHNCLRWYEEFEG